MAPAPSCLLVRTIKTGSLLPDCALALRCASKSERTFKSHSRVRCQALKRRLLEIRSAAACADRFEISQSLARSRECPGHTRVSGQPVDDTAYHIPRSQLAWPPSDGDGRQLGRFHEVLECLWVVPRRMRGSRSSGHLAIARSAHATRRRGPPARGRHGLLGAQSSRACC